jgi:hypothetical protein
MIRPSLSTRVIYIKYCYLITNILYMLFLLIYIHINKYIRVELSSYEYVLFNDLA